MFARMTSASLKTDKIEEAIDIYATSIVPAARTQKGFKKAEFLVDRKTGKAISITFWESEADAVANEKNLYYQDQLVKLMDYYAAPPVRDGFDVAVETH